MIDRVGLDRTKIEADKLVRCSSLLQLRLDCEHRLRQSEISGANLAASVARSDRSARGAMFTSQMAADTAAARLDSIAVGLTTPAAEVEANISVPNWPARWPLRALPC